MSLIDEQLDQFEKILPYLKSQTICHRFFAAEKRHCLNMNMCVQGDLSGCVKPPVDTMT